MATDTSVKERLEHYVSYKALWSSLVGALIANCVVNWGLLQNATSDMAMENVTWQQRFNESNAIWQLRFTEAQASWERRQESLADEVRALRAAVLAARGVKIGNSGNNTQTVTVAPGENPLLHKEWLTADEMGELHGVNRDTVYRRRDEGREGFVDWKREGQQYLWRNPLYVAGPKQASNGHDSGT